MTRRNRLRVAVAALAAVVALGACGSDTVVREVEKVDIEDASLVIQDMGDRLTIIDVRTADEFAAGHLEGAVNLDLEGGQFSSLIEALPKNGAYLVYCHTGRRSALAADAMVKAGFTNVRDMGGIADWEAAGLPVVTG
jgi:rhodanese-related sulfurtransferase